MTYNDGIVQAASSQLNNGLRWHKDDQKRIALLRNDLLAARLERAIDEAIHPADPAFRKLSKADRERLARVLLRG
jgi:hypothetical protein